MKKYFVEYFDKIIQKMQYAEFKSLSEAELFYNNLKNFDGKYLFTLKPKHKTAK